jgi:hypothetical protein
METAGIHGVAIAIRETDTDRFRVLHAIRPDPASVVDLPRVEALVKRQPRHCDLPLVARECNSAGILA